MKTIKLNLFIIFLTSLNYVNSQLVDVNGNNYTTTVIGNQVWMAENLKVSNFQNGDPIPNITDGWIWYGNTTPAFCVYDNDLINNSIYGKLYNWYTVQDVRNVCPIGWRVPSENDFNELLTFLDPSASNNLVGEVSQVAGGFLKENSLTYWNSPNGGASNSTGFTALPGGFREISYNYLGGDCFYWTTSEYNNANAWYRGLNHSFASVSRFNTEKYSGFSIRCMRNCVSTSSNININSCESYTAQDGQVYTQSGLITTVIPNMSGCDSVITTNLIINQNTSSSINETACETYSAPDGQIFTQSGVYSAVIPSASGCDSTMIINLMIINVNTSVSVDGVTLSSLANGSQYHWINCLTNQLISFATEQSYTPILNGDYAVIVTNGNCSDTSICYTVSSVGIGEMETYRLIYPNPTCDVLNIVKSTVNDDNFIIYDNLGIKLIEGKLSGTETQISIKDLIPGFYFLNIGEERLPITVIKQ
ncbi:MAG: hypothetical protein RL308_3290 [Bacteroidota bacterium]|jgi:uncharacterized protein (TIGR02145 family)